MILLKNLLDMIPRKTMRYSKPANPLKLDVDDFFFDSINRLSGHMFT